MQKKADLLVEIDLHSHVMRVERPALPGKPVNPASLARSVQAAGMTRKNLAVICYTGKTTEKIPETELDTWIESLRSAGFSQIVIHWYGNYVGDRELLREWPTPSRKVAPPRPVLSPFTFNLQTN